MKKIRLAKNQKGVLIAIAVIISLFALVNIAWLYMYFSIYRPIIKNDKFIKDPWDDNKSVSYTAENITAPNGDNYIFNLYVPKYMHFWGQLDMDHINPDKSNKPGELNTGLVCNPKIFSGDKLFIRVSKYTTSNSMTGYDIPVDENLNLIKDDTYSEEKETLYKECSQQAQSIFDFYESVFGYKPHT